MCKPANYYIKKENRLYELNKYIEENGTIDGITRDKDGKKIYDIFIKYKHSINEAIEELGCDINKVRKGNRSNIKEEKEIKQFVEKYIRLPNIENNIQCIYMITNKINTKVYIGQSVNIKKRWEKHIALLRNNHHTNEYLQNAWNKYGEENFNFCILEIIENEDKLTEREQYYIDIHNSHNREYGYNLKPAAKGGHLSEEHKKKIGDANRGRKLSEERKKQISEIQKGKKRKPLSEETKRKIGKANKGKIISEETRKKLSESLKGRKGKPCSEETKKKISESNKGIPRGKHTEEQRKKIGNSNRKISEDMAKCIFEKFNLLLINMKRIYIYELLRIEYNVSISTMGKLIKKMEKEGYICRL